MGEFMGTGHLNWDFFRNLRHMIYTGTQIKK